MLIGYNLSLTTTGLKSGNGRQGPILGCFLRGSVRFWLAGGAGPEVSLTYIVSTNVSDMLTEEILLAIDTACDEFAKNIEAKFVRKGED